MYCYQGKSSKDIASILGRAGYKNTLQLAREALWPGKSVARQAVPNLQRFHYHLVNCFRLCAPGIKCQPRQSNHAINFGRAPGQGGCAKLITAGADLEAVNRDGNTALWAACYAEQLHGY